MPFVDIEALGKRYGAGPAVLENIQAAVEPGEFVALIGPSGCGKSTFLRLLAGLEVPTSGRLRVGGREPAAGSKDLAFVFQDPTLLPWLTVGRNVEVPLRLRGDEPSHRARKTAQALEMVGLADRAGAYPRQLSGGQRMRASLARALSVSPRLLLLDEPFGALDELSRNRLNEELLAIRQRQGWTAFFVTHSVAEAVFLAGRILVLAPGPGRVHSRADIDLPYPRTARTRESGAYQGLVAHVTGLLRAADTP